MRIGLVSYEFPPQQGLGGVGSYMFRLANALGQAGHEVHVIAGPSSFPTIRQPNVQLHRIPAHYELDSSNPAFRWLYWRGFARTMNWMHPAIWHWLKWNLASYDAIRDLHAAQPLDLIEVPEHAANGMMAGKIHRWPIVMRMHCPWDLFVRINRFGFNPMHRVLSYLERRTAARVPDGITVPSEAMRRELARSWVLPRQPIIVPNFMDVPDEASPLPTDLDAAPIVCIGRVEPLKGQDVLVRAFAKIAAKHPHSRLFIVGPDRWPGKRRFAELLPDLVPDPQIRRRIDLYGAIPLHEVPALLKTARLVIVPSRGFESFSFAVLEAMAAARPVIASNVGAMPELVDDGQTGLVFPSGNADALGTAMSHLLSDRAVAQKMAYQGHAKARQTYHTPLVVPRIMAAYEDASDYFYQVRAAGGPATAGQWRRAIEAGRNSAGCASEPTFVSSGGV
jgi:glycosyltransferase involved in cell wall biosynthesis